MCGIENWGRLPLCPHVAALSDATLLFRFSLGVNGYFHNSRFQVVWNKIRRKDSFLPDKVFQNDRESPIF